MIDAAEHAWHTFNEAKLDPTNPAKVEAALAAHTGNRRRVQSIIDEYVASNWKSVTSDIAPATSDPNTRSTIDLGHQDTATVELCNLGSNMHG